MADLNDIKNLIDSGNVDDTLINEFYDEILEMGVGSDYLAVYCPTSPAYCGSYKYPNSCYPSGNHCVCKC